LHLHFQADYKLIVEARFGDHISLSLKIGITAKLIGDFISASKWDSWSTHSWPAAESDVWSIDMPTVAGLFKLLESEPEDSIPCLASLPVVLVLNILCVRCR
jgi:hypothetical protein